MKRSKRFAVLAQRPVNQDGLIGEWPEEGLIAMDSPFDPVSSVKVDNGLIVELDGKRRDQFDMIDRFIADYAINVERTEQAMRLEAVEIARMLVDIHVSREDHCHHYRHHAGQSGRGDGADERGGDDDGAAEDACPPDPLQPVPRHQSQR
jgi:glycerol dehydratase large subunit